MHVFNQLSGKTLLLIGILVAILLAIPLTLLLLQKQQQTKSNAAQSTKIYITPPSATIKKGDTVDLKVMVDPGSDPNTSNVVSTVTLNITYDSTLLAPKDPANCIDIPQGAALSTITVPVTCTAGNGLVHLAAGDTTHFIQASTGPQEVAMLHFVAQATGTANINFGTLTTAGSSANRDPESNVIIPNTGLQGAVITITDASVTGVPISPVPSPTIVSVQPSAAPTQAPLPPSCASITSSQGTGGMAPFSTTFTATGNAQAAGATLSKATFNFGDGTSQDVVGSASASINHIYNTPGTYRASATFTDSNGTVSQAGTCSIAMVVNGPPVTAGPTTQPLPTAEPVTGPGETILGIGAAGTVLMVIGGVLFFLL